MDKQQWTRVEEFFTDTVAGQDDVLDAALADCAAAGLPAIGVPPTQGKLLQLFARMVNARSVLEVGTLGGYSAIWMARALGDGGRLVTIEIDEGAASVARNNIERAGLSDVVEVRVGAALTVLPELADDPAAPFDLTFIDADKANNPHYVRHTIALSRPGGVIVVDNVVRNGTVVDGDSTDESVRGTRQVLELLAAEPRVSATAVQTVDSKGYDGFVLAYVV